MLGMSHTHPESAESSNVNQKCNCPATEEKSGHGREQNAGRFSKGMDKLFVGASRVDRDEFAKRFDLGVPLDKTQDGNNEVLLLYSNQKSLPDGSNITKGLEEAMISGNAELPLLNVPDATMHCDTLKIILTEPRKVRHCMAVMGQWESYTIHKYMRLPPDNIRTGLDGKLPLRKVARTHSNKGKTQIIPKNNIVEQYGREILAQYLISLPGVLNKLKVVAKKVAKDNTILVMVCNYGQSELLVNFICNCKSIGVDLSRLLVFATDLETKALADGLGVSTFYDDVNFEKLPSEAARQYGDGRFKGMMFAKVFVVHMLTQLGYDLLFQDVDVVWYQDPIPYFLNKEMEHYDFDMYFQDDGAHSVRYAPYSPNTGFYFVRANDRTQYFFNCLVRLGDMIKQSGSHQAALTAVLNEHTSYRGLTVKVFSRDTDEFPGGYHFHRGKDYMKQLFQGKVKPYVFHMSWTKNKENKKKFFEQLGQWYVHKQCSGKTAEQIKGKSMERACCLKEPTFLCHYRDKPSKEPCKDSPSIDQGHRSWW